MALDKYKGVLWWEHHHNDLRITISIDGGDLMMGTADIDERFYLTDRDSGIASVREAIELRIQAWPETGKPAGLLKNRNLAAMRTLDRVFRCLSPIAESEMLPLSIPDELPTRRMRAVSPPFS